MRNRPPHNFTADHLIFSQKWRYLAIIPWLLLLVTGCIKTPDLPMRIGTNLWPGYEPLYLARNLGFIDAERYHLVEYSSASQVIAAFRNGVIDAAALTLDEVLLLLENNFTPQIVLVMDVSNGADAILGQLDIPNLKAIRGKRVGVEDTALGAYFLSRALEQAQIEATTVQIVPMEIDKHERAFLSREVDVIVTFEPVKSKLLKNQARLLFDSTQIPNEIVDVLVVNKPYLQVNPDAVQHLIRQWFLALDYMHNQPDAASYRISKRLNITQEEVKTAYLGLILPNREQNTRLFHPDLPGSLHDTSKKLSDSMLQKQLLSHPLNINLIFPNFESIPVPKPNNL